MTISTEKKVWTDQEFMALSKDGHRYELVNNELVDMGNSPEPDGFLRPQDLLEGEAIVPGFSMSVAELFEEWNF